MPLTEEQIQRAANRDARVAKEQGEEFRDTLEESTGVGEGLTEPQCGIALLHLARHLERRKGAERLCDAKGSMNDSGGATTRECNEMAGLDDILDFPSTTNLTDKFLDACVDKPKPNI